MPKNPEETTVDVPAEDVTVEDPKAKALALLEARKAYLVDDKVRDFSQFDFTQKLAVSQTVEKHFIKRRKVGSVMVPYLPHQTAEKILNFLFNFRVSNEVISIDDNDGTQETSYTDKNGDQRKKTTRYYDAWAQVRFTFTHPDGSTITRTVIGTHKGFENPATSRHEAKKSAVSKSWTVVARTFGIGTDLEDKEDAAYGRSASRQQPQEKNFNNMNW